MSVTTLSPESTGSSKPSSLLERPAFGLLRINWETLAWILLFVVGGLARFIMLDTRAMSHDESLHTLYSYYLYANGNYDHNPMMHGPFRYHFTALIYFLFGDNDFTSQPFTSLTRTASASLTFPSVPGNDYLVEFSDDLTEWSAVIVTATGTTTTWTDLNAVNKPRRFYRVAIP